MIISDKLEIYSTLLQFQFTESQRLYFCQSVILVDITSFFRKKIEKLLIVAYEDETKAQLGHVVQQYLNGGNPVLFCKIKKVSNKRERHEVTATDGLLILADAQYKINKVFARAELEKIVPTRLIIDY